MTPFAGFIFNSGAQGNKTGKKWQAKKFADPECSDILPARPRRPHRLEA
jgi:hypothetical protein